MKKLLLLGAIMLAFASCDISTTCWKFSFKTTDGVQHTYYHWGTIEEVKAQLSDLGITEHSIESVSKSESDCKKEAQLIVIK